MENGSCCHNHPQEKKEPSKESSSSLYTCPMHPEIRQLGPGSCPICGMALEALEIDAHSEEDESEYLDYKKRFIISSILCLPLLFHLLTPKLEFLLATPIVLWAGFPFFEKFLQSLKNKNANMFTLIGMGTGVAYLHGLVAILFPQIFPPSFKNAEGHIDLYLEAASTIIVLVLFGQLLELKARKKTSQALKALFHLVPKTARKVFANDEEKDILVDEIQVGDRLRIRPGEKVPVDGVVISGNSSIDESMISGESMAKEKAPESQVIAGTINLVGTLIIEAKKIGKETLLAQIIQIVTEAQRSRPAIQKLADKVSSFFVPFVIVIAFITALIWGFIGPEPSLSYALLNSIAVLVVACPCAIGLATPISLLVATGLAASKGILFKNAEALEELQNIDTFVFDKTGTLTEGRPKLVLIRSFNLQKSEDEVLQMAASCEQASEHPLASAILNEARARNLKLMPLESFESITGVGIKAKIQGQQIFLGKESTTQSDEYQKEGMTVITLKGNGETWGILGLADPIKSSAAQALKELKHLGFHIVMLTGDNTLTAHAVAKKLAVDQVISDVLPSDKAAVIKKLQESEGRVVAMVGDGVNDAPALASARVGISMGSGTDVAIKSSCITLISGDLLGILRAIQMSQNTIRNIKQNLFFAFFYNAVGIPIAAGILYPFFGILFPPMFSAFAMSLSSVSVIFNALRLTRIKDN